MDWLDIIILAAAGVGLVAFVVLAVLLVRQGRSIRTLEERIGPPVPPAAAPSLERVRAVSSQAAPVQVVPVAQPGPEAAPGPRPGDASSSQGDAPSGQEAAPAAATAAAATAAAGAAGTAHDAPADQPVGDGTDSPGTEPAPATGESPERTRPTAREAEAARQAARDEKRARKDEQRRAKQAERGAADDEDISSGRGLIIGAIAIVVIGLLGAGGWYVFVRDDGSAQPAETAQAGTTSTAADTGEVPEDVPPLANKAAYTVAVLNASNVTGAAANKVAPRVQADGYTLGVVDNAAKQGIKASQVQYVKGRQEVGWNLAKDLGITRAVPVDSLAQGRIGTADAVVIVGTDLAK